MRVVTREMRRQLERDNAKRPALLAMVPREHWPAAQHDPKRLEVWLSREYLVQVFAECDGVQRVSVNRTTARPGGRWDDGLSWDEMQEIKRQIGRGDLYAVEIYPRDRDVVNVANMRHIWVLPAPLSIGWFKTPNVYIWTPPLRKDEFSPETGKAAQIYPACIGQCCPGPDDIRARGPH